jgi:16S rRNA (guanine527-N7)-methyltransferase
MDLLQTYFPKLGQPQKEQLEALPDLYKSWNDKINVISRKDEDQILLHHVLHSLSIAKLCPFQSDTQILDLGTGGGFPGIPLAIFFPEVQFNLIDGTAKKIKVVKEIIDALGLKNVVARQQRAEEIKGEQYDFVVSRAVAELSLLWTWVKPLIHQKHKNALPNGLIALKGGNLKTEIKAMPRNSTVEVTKITDYFKDFYFEEKVLIYVQR